MRKAPEEPIKRDKEILQVSIQGWFSKHIWSFPTICLTTSAWHRYT
jgi:hypothetical protein